MTNIRKASSADLQEVKKWLDEERRTAGPGDFKGFGVNWSVIEATHKEGNLYVVTDSLQAVVGFLADANAGPNIIEICPQHRGKGFARQLMDFAIERARRRGNAVIEIEAAPRSSKPVWQHLGFEFIEGRQGMGGGDFGCMELPLSFAIPPHVTQIPYAVRFFDKARDWDSDVPPFRSYEGMAALVGDGQLQLPRRAICYHPYEEHAYDLVVQIEINGSVVFEDKVKREKAARWGVVCDPSSNYYMDVLTGTWT